MKGVLVILSGPSGVGKDTLLNAWIAENPRVRRVVTYTTRPPRPTEVEGVDYCFVSLDRFRQLQADGAFLEAKEVHGNWYASPLRDTERMLAEGLVAVLKIDVQGAMSVVPLRPDAVTIFVMPPSEAELERRIRGRATDTEEAIETRLANARQELAQASKYHYRVVNDDIERAVTELNRVIAAS